MKTVMYIFILIIYLFTAGIVPVAALIDENPLIPYIDSGDGRGVNPGTKPKTVDEQVKKKQATILDNIYNSIFNNQDSTNFTNPTNPSPLPTTIIPTPNNLLPTGAANPSITYFPQPDSGNLLNDSNLVYTDAMLAQVRNCITNKKVYEIAAEHTGVPWTVLASLHYTETGGSCGANESSVSGREIGTIEPDLYGECSSGKTGLGVPKPMGGKNCGLDNLLDSLVYSGIHIKQKNIIGQADGIPRSHEELVFAVSKYNGGGNSNCRTDRNTIAPYYYIPGNCPELFEGESDTYVFNKTPDGKHDVMYIRFCDDGKACGEIGRATPVHQVYGVITVAGALSRL